MAMERENYVLPAGKLYFDLELDDGSHLGERYIGDTPGFSITVETERQQFFSADSKTREKKRDIVVEINRSSEITCRDITTENLALFLAGDQETLTQATGTVTDEEVGPVKQGHWYQLGTSASFPAGVREISDVVVKDDAEATITMADNYALDLELGRIYIIEGGAIEDDDEITVTYDKEDATIVQVKSGAFASRKGRLRFIANNREGANRDAFFPLVDIGPSGALEMKGEDWQEVAFTCEILKPETLEAIYINNRAVVIEGE